MLRGLVSDWWHTAPSNLGTRMAKARVSQGEVSMRTLVLLFILSVCATAQAPKYEYSKTPVKDGPFVHLRDEPAHMFVHEDTVNASGVWVASGSSSPPSGPSVSEISCSRPDRSCHEQMANIVVIGDTFSVNPDSADYQVTRWNETEIVAENRDVQASPLAGNCHLLGVLKIDLLHKKVYAYQTLAEPVVPGDSPSGKLIDSAGMCKAANNTLWELHDETMFSFAADAKTVTTSSSPKQSK